MAAVSYNAMFPRSTRPGSRRYVAKSRSENTRLTEPPDTGPGHVGQHGRYGLTVDPQEAAALEAMLEGCRIEHVLRPYRPEPSPLPQTAGAGSVTFTRPPTPTIGTMPSNLRWRPCGTVTV